MGVLVFVLVVCLSLLYVNSLIIPTSTVWQEKTNESLETPSTPEPAFPRENLAKTVNVGTSLLPLRSYRTPPHRRSSLLAYTTGRKRWQ
jgi:hypothetical protein